MKLKLTFSWMLEGYIFLFESNEFFFSYWKIFSLFLQRFQKFHFLVWKFPDLRRFTDLRVERILGERKKILNAQKRNSKTGTRIKIVKYSRNGVVRKRKKNVASAETRTLPDDRNRMKEVRWTSVQKTISPSSNDSTWSRNYWHFSLR